MNILKKKYIYQVLKFINLFDPPSPYATIFFSALPVFNYSPQQQMHWTANDQTDNPLNAVQKPHPPPPTGRLLVLTMQPCPFQTQGLYAYSRIITWLPLFSSAPPIVLASAGSNCSGLEHKRAEGRDSSWTGNN